MAPAGYTHTLSPPSSPQRLTEERKSAICNRNATVVGGVLLSGCCDFLQCLRGGTGHLEHVNLDVLCLGIDLDPVHEATDESALLLQVPAGQDSFEVP